MRKNNNHLLAGIKTIVFMLTLLITQLSFGQSNSKSNTQSPKTATSVLNCKTDKQGIVQNQNAYMRKKNTTNALQDAQKMRVVPNAIIDSNSQKPQLIYRSDLYLKKTESNN